MQLYTGPLSTAGKRVRICAAELGVALDAKLVDFQRGDNRSPEYLALNPMGKVPTLTDGDLVLWESSAILCYLARTSGGPLWPEEPRAQADLLRWMFFGASHLDPHFTTLVVERLFKATRGEAADQALCASAERSLARFLPVVEQQLSGQGHLTGQFGLADITLGCTLDLSPMLGYDLGPWPGVRAWLDRLRARESWRASSMGQVKPAAAGTPTRERFVNAYDGGVPPPWDLGHAQPDLVALFDELSLSGSALDVGCGTGENVLELSRRGLDAWGLDTTPAAIAAAEKKREARGLAAIFVLGDALDLGALHRTFDTVLDCGLFHVLEDEERRRYVRELGHALRPGGRHLMLGFATNTRGFGPRGYSPEELRAFFAGGFREVLVRPTSFQVTNGAVPQAAWVSVFVRADKTR
jgi:glutathione S-transferase/SAM-dependent methyltransferase